MLALLKIPSSATITSKVIVQDTCRSQKWKNKSQVVAYVHSALLSRPASPAVTVENFSNAFIPASSIKWKKDTSPRMSSTLLLLSVDKHNVGYYTCRKFSVGSISYDKEPLKPSSKVEESVKAIKEKESKGIATAVGKETKAKTSILDKVKNEILHYYHGFRLLFIDINISRKLLWRVLKGKTLTRREHRLLVRTVGDLFRLLPFSVFIIVPFMELLLPFAIKLFPGMLPSTFQSATARDDKLKQSLKVRLEMAKFLQTTLDDMSVQSKDKSSASSKEFTEFFKKIRSSGEPPTNEEILKFSTLFEDEIILDSLSRQQLTALCRVLDISPVGTTNLLRFQIRMRLRNLVADDKMILKEGVDSLTIPELQAACQARAMRAYGVSEDKLKSQLGQWLNLSINGKVPTSLLLLSRALMLPDTIAASDQLKATISALPNTVELKAKAAMIEREGIIDNKTKIELIKEEVKQIKEEMAEQEEQDMKKVEKKAEILIDDAPILSETATEFQDMEKKEEISSKDLETLEDALDALGKEKKKFLVEKEELHELKEELQDYEEDVKELKEVLATSDKKTEMRETKAAQRLFKKVNNMISKMDGVLADLESKGQKIKETDADEMQEKEEELVKIDELMDVIKRIQKIPDESKLHLISKILEKMDVDQDGAISVDDVLKVIELIGKEHVELSSKQLDEIIELLDKEEALEIEEQIERALEKQSPVEKVTTSALKAEATKSGTAVTPKGNLEKITIVGPKDVGDGTPKEL